MSFNLYLSKKIANTGYGSIISLIILAMVFGFSCRRTTSNKGPGGGISDGSNAIVSIGKLPDSFKHDSIEIDISVDGSKSTVIGNDNLVKKVYSAGQAAIVGAKVYKDKKVVAETVSNSSESKCPYVTKILDPGVNHVTLRFCVIASDGKGVGEGDLVTTEDKSKKVDVVIETVLDDTVEMPKGINVEIHSTLEGETDKDKAKTVEKKN